MNKQFRAVSISVKLTAMGMAFIIPLMWLLYTNIRNINHDIRFNTLEYEGNQFQKPLMRLLESIPEHGLLLASVEQGAGAASGVTELARTIDVAFEDLLAVDADIGEDLQFTEQGLGIRGRAHLAPEAVKSKWERLKASMPSDPNVILKTHWSLMDDILGMISHVGDTSNLILDPDLDSYYLMDITLLALPQTHRRLADIMAFTEQARLHGGLSETERRRLHSYAELLRESDYNRVLASTATSLNEDQNFLGLSESLQNTLPVAMSRYKSTTEPFVSMLMHMADGGDSAISAQRFRETYARARDESFRFWESAVAELDKLLLVRIDAYRQDRLVTLAGLAVAVALATLLAWMISRSINAPLRRTSAYLQAVASGDLDSTLEGRCLTTEICVLNENLRIMVRTLKQSLAVSEDKSREAERRKTETEQALARVTAQEAEVHKLLATMKAVAEQAEAIAAQVSDAVDALASQVTQVSSGAEVQSRRTGESAVAMQQMNASVLEVARNASKAAEQAEATMAKARQGAEVVVNSVQAISRVKEKADSTKRDLSDLSEQAESIGRIMSVISDIADQTNLLALNAAIEAARAGEAGRGFAVVADEVRKLAEKTMNATKEVAVAIKAIQGGTRTVVQGMDDSAKAVDQAI
ncbi:methyl-accepting chemotaxis protein [Desulfocurvibacter africanus PCS]|uniref:Methyl-accepting chemotaxis protein n=1 Tax=Desulfocurvibacter africanus PCS TaxID=1262666 RepID=M5PUN4_DESAF|nr:methyl-accepting chemotaxis protein [Desulfocurvibacter africanus]EMG37720.1 methyl-accepting chemotaxis protein [Desulfocurvibacter africanus PCS]